MEGTLIEDRLDESVPAESEIEKQMVRLCQETKGAVFVSVPSLNIDRIITLYRAGKQAGRKFIIDLRSAELLDSSKIILLIFRSPHGPMCCSGIPHFSVRGFMKKGSVGS